MRCASVRGVECAACDKETCQVDFMSFNILGRLLMFKLERP